MNNNIKKIVYEKNRILIYNPSSELNQSFISSLTEYSNYNKFAKKILFQAIKYIKLEDNTYVLCIPRFYPSKYLQQYFPDYIVEDNLNSEYNKFDTIELNCKYEPRDEIQQEALKYLCSKDEYYYTKKFEHQKVLVLQTGLGKTYCAIKHICNTNLKTIITTPNKNLFEKPWKKDLFEYTDLKEEELLEIDNATTIKKVIKYPDKYKHIKVMLVCNKTIGSLLSTEQGIQILQEFYKVTKIGLRINDEAHLDYKVITLTDFYIPTYKVLALTATPSRTSYSSNKIYKYILPSNNYWFGLDIEHRRDPHINFLFHIFDSKPSEIDQSKMLKKAGVNNSEYSNYLSNNGFDNIVEQIIPYVSKITDKNFRVVIVCGTLELVGKLKEVIPEYINNKSVGEFTSNIKDKELRDLEFRKDIILTTEKSLGQGNDYNIGCIINLTKLSSEVAIPQLAGRLRDIPNSPCLFIDMVDKGFIRIQQQFAKNKPFVKKELAKNLTVINS